MSKFLKLFKGEKQTTPPIWFMRQAGRYLPEYREIRKKHQRFLELCYTPDLAATITLQPLKRFSLDAAILFSDILVVPNALGQKVSFEKKSGPYLEPLSLAFFEKQLSLVGFLEKAAPVYEAAALTKERLSSSKALLGFAGAPWTLALYMIEGGASRDFSKAKEKAFKNEEQFSELLAYLVEAISIHLIEQVKAGAQAIQLFDTWAGLCPATHFERWVLLPTKQIVSKIRAMFPELPIIGFPKGVGPLLKDYGAQTNVSAISLDATTSLSWAKRELPSSLVLQGNLDPVLLVAGGQPLKKAIVSLKREMEGGRCIFNLGHGILPQTPPSHVEACVQMVRGLS